MIFKRLEIEVLKRQSTKKHKNKSFFLCVLVLEFVKKRQVCQED